MYYKKLFATGKIGNLELKNRIDDLGKRIVFLENQLSQKDKKISDLEDKVIALKGRIAGLDAYICELNGELRTYNPLPGVRAILRDARKFVDGSLRMLSMKWKV